jgi:hypothetical protein
MGGQAHTSLEACHRCGQFDTPTEEVGQTGKGPR